MTEKYTFKMNVDDVKNGEANRSQNKLDEPKSGHRIILFDETKIYSSFVRNDAFEKLGPQFN